MTAFALPFISPQPSMLRSAAAALGLEHLSLRLSAEEGQRVAWLSQKTGLSKTELVKRGLELLADQVAQEQAARADAFSLGQDLFGKYGNAERQSRNVKAVVRERLAAKRERRAVATKQA